MNDFLRGGWRKRTSRRWVCGMRGSNAVWLTANGTSIYLGCVLGSPGWVASTCWRRDRGGAKMRREVTLQRARSPRSPPDAQRGPDRSRLLQPSVSPALLPARPPDAQPDGCGFFGIGHRGGHPTDTLELEAGEADKGWVRD